MGIIGGIGVPELIIVLTSFIVPLVLVALAFVVLYFVVRKAVRDGMCDAMGSRSADGAVNPPVASEK